MGEEDLNTLMIKRYRAKIVELETSIDKDLNFLSMVKKNKSSKNNSALKYVRAVLKRRLQLKNFLEEILNIHIYSKDENIPVEDFSKEDKDKVVDITSEMKVLTKEIKQLDKNIPLVFKII